MRTPDGLITRNSIKDMFLFETDLVNKSGTVWVNDPAEPGAWIKIPLRGDQLLQFCAATRDFKQESRNEPKDEGNRHRYQRPDLENDEGRAAGPAVPFKTHTQALVEYIEAAGQTPHVGYQELIAQAQAVGDDYPRKVIG